MVAAEIICSLRNPLFKAKGEPLRTVHSMAIIKRKPTATPSIGDKISANMILRTPNQCSAEKLPVCAVTAPMSPPMRACDDDDGMPKYHVNSPHKMAAPTLARMTNCVTLAASTMSRPMVVATLVEMMAPTKLRTAAMVMAERIERARVEMQVAMALAASLKPLM